MDGGAFTDRRRRCPTAFRHRICPLGTAQYNKDANNATNPTTGAIVIPNHAAYNFKVSGATTDQQTAYNCNVFKRFPGFAGLVLDAQGDPIKGVTVNIFGPNSTTKLLAAVVTDEDEWYQYTYKHTSKPATFYLRLPKYPSVPQQSVSMVANQLRVVNFVVPNP